MPRKVKIILNPMADMHHAWQTANDLRPIVEEYGHADWSGTVYPTHATKLAAKAADEGFDMVIAMGGDGTVHEVVNGLMQVPAERRPILGVVPMGSGNDFAHAIGIPTGADHALAHALEGEPSSIDLGLMTDDHGRQEYFDNTLGIGFDAVVTIRSHRLPVLRGFMMYLTAVIQTIMLNHDPALVQFQTDQEAWEDRVLMTTLCNGPREGGELHVVIVDNGRSGILASHLNFGDPRRGWDFRSLGRGGVNFEEIIRALNHIGYQGPLSVEWEDSGMDRDHGAKEACEFVKRIDFEPSRVAFDAAFDKEEQKKKP